MREVPAVLFGFMCRAFQTHGVDTTAKTAGLRLASVDPDRFGDRVDWDDLALFLDRCGDGLGDAELEAVGETYVEVSTYIQLVLRTVRSVGPAVRVLAELARHAFPHMEVAYRELRHDRLRLDIALPPPYRACRTYFRAAVGVLRALPGGLALPPAPVQAEVASRHGSYDVRLPMDGPADPVDEQQQLATDLIRVLSYAFQHDDAGAEAMIGRLRGDHGLTQAEARVALRIARGQSVKMIAYDLGVSVHTVRTHLKRAYAKTGTHRQAELARFILKTQ
ncbi:MAG: helix-turn-helix transcriptional regulator [Myxococcota bacterium]